MSSRNRLGQSGLLIGGSVLGVLLGACGSPQSAAPAPAAQAAPEPVVITPAEQATPVVMEAAKRSLELSGEPALAAMKVARQESSKMGVPVELRYLIEGDAMTGQPVTVYLAAVPREAGTNLAVSVKEDAGIQFQKAALNAQKVEAATAYRQQLQVVRLAGGPQQLRVLVTMDFPIGTGFSYFTVPLGAAAQEKKQ